MKTGKNFVRFALALALVISMVAAMSVGALAGYVTEPEREETVVVPTDSDTILTVYGDENLPLLYVDYNITTNAASGGTVTADSPSAAANDTVTLTVTTADGYQFSRLSVTDGSGNDITTTTVTEGKTYTFTMPAAAVTVSATFEQVAAYLDSTTATKTVDQSYSLALDGGSYTDATKVKVEWTTTDISATRTDNKTWNPGTLTWDDTTDTNSVTAGDGTAAFTLTNLSSTQVAAAVTFAQGSTFTAPTVAFTVDDNASDTGAAIIGTVVNSDKTVTSANDHAAVIGVTVTPAGDDFKALSAASDTQYGTYTVTIGAVS